MRRAAREPVSASAINYGPLEQLFGYQLRRAYSYLYRTFIADFKELQLAPGQYCILVLISLNPGMSQVDLAEATGLDGSTIVPITDRFERLGWIRRTRRRSDRRLYSLRITPLGQDILDKARPIIATRQRRLASILSPDERQQLIALLSRINAMTKAVPRGSRLSDPEARATTDAPDRKGRPPDRVRGLR